MTERRGCAAMQHAARNRVAFARFALAVRRRRRHNTDHAQWRGHDAEGDVALVDGGVQCHGSSWSAKVTGSSLGEKAIGGAATKRLARVHGSKEVRSRCVADGKSKKHEPVNLIRFFYI